MAATSASLAGETSDWREVVDGLIDDGSGNWTNTWTQTAVTFELQP